jgi:hypothetical protein
VAPVLDRLTLNRALLARRHLLARTDRPVPAMVEHLVGMQAQNPGDPYVALWSRLAAFAPGELSDPLAERRAVRMSLLRMTLHLVTADDAMAMRPVIADVGPRVFRSTAFAKDLAGIDLAPVLAAGRDLLDRDALSSAELAARLGSKWPDRVGPSLAQAVQFHLPLVQVPPRGLWRAGGRARWRTLDSWLGRSVDGPTAPDGVVLRYLGAFGPASVQDVAVWSRLTRIREVIERLRPRLRVFRDEAGAELFDIPGAPLPDPDTTAPHRFLPEYDNIALSHVDRSRIIASASMGRLTGFVGTFLVDGFVAGQWRLDRTTSATTVVLDPFVRLGPGERDALVAEADRLLAFLAPEAEARSVAFGVARGS